MSIVRSGALRALLGSLCVLLPACAEPDDAPAIEETIGEQVSQPIVGGTPATTYLEAALINMPGTICSGAVIAPQVAITAGHCVVGNTSFTVTTPFSGNQTARGKSTWTEYVDGGEFVDPNSLDVAVIVLDRPINLAFYPPLASAIQPNGTSAVNVGRIRNGTASFSQLFVGAPVTLRNAASSGFPKAYITSEVIQSGDSGGPVYVGSGASRMIAAVNSGSGGGTQVLARVDLAYTKIQQIIAANGGSGGTTTTPPPTTPPPTTPPPTTPPPATCTGTAEAEPNDASTSANPLSGTRCGALSSGSDIDWYTWNVSGAGVAYEVSLTATGNADILMWKWSGTAWSQISNTTPTKIAATSSGAGRYVVAVRGSSAQTYALKLKN
ncbi:MAG: trypsin-like serine protease [Deltaproteobacteria bacterium]|nr:trypsin-like serine protease [Deltaproteobacteria bacterium]